MRINDFKIMANKAKHGGVRAGSGRKPNHPGEETQRIEMTLPKSIVTKIDRRANQQNKSRASIVGYILSTAFRLDGS